MYLKHHNIGHDNFRETKTRIDTTIAVWNVINLKFN